MATYVGGLDAAFDPAAIEAADRRAGAARGRDQRGAGAGLHVAVSTSTPADAAGRSRRTRACGRARAAARRCGGRSANGSSGRWRRTYWRIDAGRGGALAFIEGARSSRTTPVGSPDRPAAQLVMRRCDPRDERRVSTRRGSWFAEAVPGARELRHRAGRHDRHGGRPRGAAGRRAGGRRSSCCGRAGSATERARRDRLPVDGRDDARRARSSKRARTEEAEQVLEEIEIVRPAPADFDPQARLRSVRALILAARGEPDEAERLAREAVAIVEPTDYLEMRADALRRTRDGARLGGQGGGGARRLYARPRALRAEGDHRAGCAAPGAARMSTRRRELTREAARLFAQKGYHGTSIGDIAEALGVQKGSLYSHIASKEDLLYETLREGAAAFHAALDEIPDDAAAGREDPPRAPRPPAGRRRAARRRHRLRPGVALPRGRAARGVRRRAAPVRGADPRAAPRGPRPRRAALRPRRRRRRAAPALGRELGLHVAAARPRHRRARRPLLRAARRRHARLLDAGVTRIQIRLLRRCRRDAAEQSAARDHRDEEETHERQADVGARLAPRALLLPAVLPGDRRHRRREGRRPRHLQLRPAAPVAQADAPLRIVLVGFKKGQVDESALLAQIPESQRPGVLIPYAEDAQDSGDQCGVFFGAQHAAEPRPLLLRERHSRTSCRSSTTGSRRSSTRRHVHDARSSSR